ncbi:MAG: MFS transporter [Hydrogenophaga sp.]|nr:MFS transporter [Hydrogenophaga sp.]
MAALSLVMLLPALGTSIANVALPSLTQTFGAAFATVQWVVIAYLLTITALVVSAGRLGDLVGRRRLLLSGLAVFTLASAAAAIAPGLGWLIAARVAQGAGAATLMALTLALVSEVVPKGKAGAAMGWLGTVSAVGTALGPTLGGVLIGMAGWSAVFWINVPLGMVAWAMAVRHLPRTTPITAAKVRFDLTGTVLLTATLSSYALALTLGQGQAGSVRAALWLATTLGAAAFVWTQRRATAPLIRPALLRQPTLAAGFVANALVTAVVMATLVVGPFYLAGALGLTTTRMGLLMSVGPLVAALVGAPAGRLVDRMGHTRVGHAGLGLMLAGSVTMPWSAPLWGAAGYAGALALLTAGYAAFQAANNTGVMASASADQRGLVSGLLNLSRNLGLITGASAMGTVFQLGARTVSLADASAPALTAGLRWSFAAATLAVLLAAAATLMARTQAASSASSQRTV